MTAPLIATLGGGLDGRALLPGDAGYDEARSLWNAMVDRRPDAIVQCASASDVASTVRFARANDLELGVRCGGHGVTGLAVPDGGLMIDLRPLCAVEVDPERRRARVEGGAMLGALDLATVPHGLATTAGNVSHTGVGGLTLGGGMGWLARLHGLTCDNVAAYEVITADGSLVRASDSENADLYWGLRGGGGNFGVVTAFEFRLHEIQPQAIVANFFFPVDRAFPVFREWRELNATAPREATFTAWVGDPGPAPFIPADLHGEPLASVGLVWMGDPEQGAELVARLRGLARPVAEQVSELSYVDLQRMDDTVEGHTFRRYWKGHYFRELPDEAIEAFLLRGTSGGKGEFLPGASLQAYGGAIGDVADADSAFSHRGTLFEFVAAARWSDPAEDQPRMAAARRYAATLDGFSSGAYVNVLTDEGEAGVRRAYPPEKLARLTQVKDAYDPDNVFHLNHNVRPTAKR